jgi:GNAT superfamily N-acetyltransferase
MLLDLVPAGHIASVITSLEMRGRPRLRQMPFAPLRLIRWPRPSLEAYRGLYRRVGEPWLWYSRLQMDDNALISKIHAETTQIMAVTDVRGGEVGLLELDFSEPGSCEIAFFGLIREWTGQGHGHWLMAQVHSMAWRPGIERLWVHTCSLDHPGALRFYLSCGFQPFSRAIEIVPDPRIDGTLSPMAAPQIPIIRAEG